MLRGSFDGIFIYLYPRFNLCDQLDLVRFLKMFHLLSRRHLQSWNLFAFFNQEEPLRSENSCVGEVAKVAAAVS